MSFANLKKQSKLGSLTAKLVKEVEKLNTNGSSGDDRLWKLEVDMIKKKLIESAKMFGYHEIDDMNKFFDRLDKTISEIESSIDKC